MAHIFIESFENEAYVKMRCFRSILPKRNSVSLSFYVVFKWTINWDMYKVLLNITKQIA